MEEALIELQANNEEVGEAEEIFNILRGKGAVASSDLAANKKAKKYQRPHGFTTARLFVLDGWMDRIKPWSIS